MSADFAEKEKEFVTSLEADTGRDLGAWMAAISACGFMERNDIIDWLRHQRFTFAKASWLERIHNNGGKLIYSDAEIAPVAAAPAVPAPAPVAAPPPAAHAAPSAAHEGDINAALSAAKGLRPLAELVLRELASAVPDTQFFVDGPLIVAAAPATYAALLPGPKKLKLYSDFSTAGQVIALAGEPVNKSPPPFPHMLLLDDARQIDDGWRDAVRAAAPPVPVQRRA